MSRSISHLLLARSLFSFLTGPPMLHAVLATALAGCETARDIAVRVSIPGPDSLETPAAGVGIIALPYDRDSVLASLEAKAGTSRPHTAALESLFVRFRSPFTAYTSLTYTLGELRDSLGRLQARLDSLPRESAEYRGLRTRANRVADSVTALESRAERARLVLDRARAEFVNRSEGLRRAVRQWEDSTYRGYDSIVENLANARGRQAATDTTGATGWAHFSLPPGRWWVYARAWDTSDPNAEWYWNLPVREDTILLSSRSGQRRPRY